MKQLENVILNHASYCTCKSSSIWKQLPVQVQEADVGSGDTEPSLLHVINVFLCSFALMFRDVLLFSTHPIMVEPDKAGMFLLSGSFSFPTLFSACSNGICWVSYNISKMP